jgi:hypothetical protein
MTSSKARFVKERLSKIKNRAKTFGIPFDLDYEYLISIATDECPVFKTPFLWEISGLGHGKQHDGTPQLDRIIPELGYVRGNVAFLSGRANKMKDGGTMQEHYAIADWIWEQTHAKEKSVTPVPTGSYIQGEVHSELGTFSPAGFREDDDIYDDSGGAV